MPRAPNYNSRGDDYGVGGGAGPQELLGAGDSCLQEEGYMPHMLKESRLNRPLYAIPEGVGMAGAV